MARKPKLIVHAAVDPMAAKAVCGESLTQPPMSMHQFVVMAYSPSNKVTCDECVGRLSGSKRKAAA